MTVNPLIHTSDRFFFNNRYFSLASPAGCEPARKEVLASQKPNAPPTELSGRPKGHLVFSMSHEAFVIKYIKIYDLQGKCKIGFTNIKITDSGMYGAGLFCWGCFYLLLRRSISDHYLRSCGYVTCSRPQRTATRLRLEPGTSPPIVLGFTIFC